MTCRGGQNFANTMISTIPFSDFDIELYKESCFLPTDHGTDFDAYEVVYQTWGHMILQYLLPLGVMITLNILMLRTVSKK